MSELELSSNAANQDDPPTDHDGDGHESYAYVYEDMYTEDVGKYIDENGLRGMEEFFKKKLEKWKDVEINIAVTGSTGTGKSSFINAIRGLKDYDEGAAKTGLTETTTRPTKYPHPENNKINLWDLPGIGTPDYPAETYWKKVNLETYDTFLILSATRFTENDLKLVRMVTSIEKTFFFVRTKIDLDLMNESLDKPTPINEDEVLKNVKKDCLLNLKEFPSEDEDVFLISKRKTATWDFPRLTQAILDALPIHQRESLTFTLNLLTIRSKEILKRKVEVLRGRVWMAAIASGVSAILPVPSNLSQKINDVYLQEVVNFYNSQLGLTENNANNLSSVAMRMVEKFSSISVEEVVKFATDFAASSGAETTNRYIPHIIKPVIEGAISANSAIGFLHHCLDEIETIALAFLEDLKKKLEDDLPKV